MEGVDDGEDVVAEAVGFVVCGGGYRCGGGAEAATGDSVDVVVGGELGREFVPDMGGVAKAGEKDHGTASASPVKDFELDVLLNIDELDFMGRGIDLPGCGGGGALEGEWRGLALREGSDDGVAGWVNFAFVRGVNGVDGEGERAV